MRNVLADLCLESEAATVTAMRLARAYDRRADDPARGGLRPNRDGDREVLDLQARSGPCGRGARVPRRQRLRRGIGAAAALPAEPAAVHLGRIGQRDLPRRPPRARARAGVGRGPARRDRARGRPAADGARRAGARRGRRGPRPVRRRAARARAPGIAPRPAQPGGRRGRIPAPPGSAPEAVLPTVRSKPGPISA